MAMEEKEARINEAQAYQYQTEATARGEAAEQKFAAAGFCRPNAACHGRRRAVSGSGGGLCGGAEGHRIATLLAIDGNRPGRQAESDYRRRPRRATSVVPRRKGLDLPSNLSPAVLDPSPDSPEIKGIKTTVAVGTGLQFLAWNKDTPAPLGIETKKTRYHEEAASACVVRRCPGGRLALPLVRRRNRVCHRHPVWPPGTNFEGSRALFQAALPVVVGNRSADASLQSAARRVSHQREEEYRPRRVCLLERGRSAKVPGNRERSGRGNLAYPRHGLVKAGCRRQPKSAGNPGFGRYK